MSITVLHRRARRAALALGLTATLALTGCSDDDGDSPDATRAADALDQAVSNFSAEESGSYTFQLGDDSDPLMRSSGEFDLEDDVATVDLTLSNGQRRQRSQQVRLGERRWFRTAKRNDAAPAGCWRTGSPPRGANLAGIPLTGSAGPFVAPPVVGVVTTAVGEEWVTEASTEGSKSNTVKGTADLYAVASTLGNAVASLGISAEDTSGRVDVTFLLDGDNVMAWSTDLVTVLKGLSDAGVKLDGDTQRLVESGAEVPVMAGFSKLGDDVDVEEPTPVC
ncbi:hypothetical protein [Nocardioides jishulii]|uniref:LppX_LprAFG lipoprotein n=1 Tax=Nocardioides jishulii TaxID=2575440 RepID=A0A4U2YTY6_9ACTN|nr:hypothetical protein [Nocardioides jishulii]QCX28928.1 hypothetical protein FCL41_16435 [Nocardioides jishulii]TKI64172.1 hypothetical protein FC770_03130 [Nocardioides jishulii]